MEPSPVSKGAANASIEPTPEELEAGASLMQAPERLESRATDAPPPASLHPAVKNLVDKCAPPPPALPAPSRPHDGMTLGVGASLAIGPARIGAEVSAGVVLDFTEPRIAVFTNRAWGPAVGTGVSAGVSGQASVVNDVQKFAGEGTSIGLNGPEGGGAINLAKPASGGRPEFNGITVSAGPSLGGDLHYFEGTTVEHFSFSLQDLKDLMKSIPSPRRLGP